MSLWTSLSDASTGRDVFKRTLFLGLVGFLIGAMSGTLPQSSWQWACGFLVISIFGFLARRANLISRQADQPACKGSNAPHFEVLACMVAHLCLLIGLYITNSTAQLWPVDARTLHLPATREVYAWLQGEADIQFGSLFGSQLRLTYLWQALWFSVFGETPLVTGVSMLFIRALTWCLAYLVGFRLFGAKAALLALSFMALNPTQIYYSMLLYKDPLVQLLVVGLLFFMLKLTNSEQRIVDKISLLALIALCLAALMIERAYMPPLFFASIFLIAIAYQPRSQRSLWRQLVVLSSILVAVGALWVIDIDFNISTLKKDVLQIRANFNSYPDIDPRWNSELPYPVAIVKLLFSPYFTPRKLTLFTELSSLLTFGALVSQITIGFALYGLWLHFKRYPMIATATAMPLVFFLVLFGYLAPFSGRQRDAFFPIIAIYAAAGTLDILARLNQNRRGRNLFTARVDH